LVHTEDTNPLGCYAMSTGTQLLNLSFEGTVIPCSAGNYLPVNTA